MQRLSRNSILVWRLEAGGLSNDAKTEGGMMSLRFEGSEVPLDNSTSCCDTCMSMTAVNVELELGVRPL